MAIILPMTATKMIYPKMILCCNGIRFFSIRITSYPLKKQILTTADLAARPATKLNNIFLFFLSQQKEEHTTLPPFFIRILS